MPVVVLATITPQPEHRNAVREAVLAAIPRVHEEPGCQRYALHEGPDSRLVMIEQWESPEALAAHGKAEALAELGRALAGKLTGEPRVEVLTAVPTGDGAKGAL